MANQFLNAQEYSNVMLLLLKNQLVFGRLVDGQFKDQVTDENGLKISVKRPPRFIDKKDGTANLAAQDILTGSAFVDVTEYSKVHIEVGDIEYVTSYNALMQNATMRSAAQTLAHSIDMYLAGMLKKFPSWVRGGTPGVNASIYANATDPTKAIQSPSQAMAAHTRLMAQGVPNESLSGIVTFEDGQYIRGSLLTDFMPGDINVPALQRTRIPIISEIDWYATQQLPVITTGTRTQGDGSSAGVQIDGGTLQVNYRDVKDTMEMTIHVDGLSTNTIKAGEVFTIEDVYAWDWRAQQVLPYLQQFTVMEDVTGVGGDADVVISPPIIVQGSTDGVNTDGNTAFATVNAAPVNDAYVQFAGAASTPIQIKAAFHKRAISLVSARLHTPFTGISSFATDPDTGISVRYWRGSDISTGKHVHRWDCLYGGAVMDPFLGTRVAGQNPD